MLKYLPLLLILVLLDPARAQPLGEPLPMRVVLASGHYFDTGEPPLYAVWQDQGEREAFLRDHPKSGLDRPAYYINFSREMALVVAFGSRGYSNAFVSVDAVVDAGDRLLVYTTEYEPCGGPRMVINPAVIVAVPCDQRPVEFLPTRVVPGAYCP